MYISELFVGTTCVWTTPEITPSRSLSHGSSSFLSVQHTLSFTDFSREHVLINHYISILGLGSASGRSQPKKSNRFLLLLLLSQQMFIEHLLIASSVLVH